MIIVSACLAGIHCRYDGDGKPCEAVIRLVVAGKAIPVCPEQLGRLPTPKLPAERVGDRFIKKDGMDVTNEFERGAEEALRLSRLIGARTAILKARSPSCGYGKIYDGSFSGRLVDGNGILAELCLKEGLEVKKEEEIKKPSEG
jgi:uncharacterized protein YbbK (DUF523 family)